jgi:hypothetical protein
MTRRDQNIVRSRYRIFHAPFWGLFALAWVVVTALVIEHNTISLIDYGGISIMRPLRLWMWIIVVFNLLIWMFVLNVLLRYIVIDREKGCATCYSLFRPFGKKFFFRDYIGIYITEEISRFPSGYGVHLVDGRYVRRLMSCALYRNYDELRGAIPLPEPYRYKGGVGIGGGVMLLITGRTKVPKHWTQQKRKTTKH